MPDWTSSKNSKTTTNNLMTPEKILRDMAIDAWLEQWFKCYGFSHDYPTDEEMKQNRENFIKNWIYFHKDDPMSYK